MRPRVLLRCFGDVAIDGAVVSQAVAVPFVIAAAARPLTDVDVAEITGYNRKTLSTVWTTTNAVLTRENGALTLGDGVWTDYDWMADCVAQARSAAAVGDLAVATGWLQRVFVDLSRLDGHAYERPAGKKDYWRWVDEYPGDVTARQHAEQQLVETALAACQLRDQLAIAEVIAADQVVVIVGNLAQLFPFVPVAAGVRPDEFRTGGECLLLAGHHAAAGRPDLREIVATIAKRLVADGRIEPSDLLADALDH